jgi:dihydrofolate reductase
MEFRLVMRKLVAWVFMYSLNGLLADEGTAYWDFCFGLPADMQPKIDLYEDAYAHIMGRTTYEAMADSLSTADHAFSGILNTAPRSSSRGP